MSAISFREDIQGIRAIAVLSVVVFHFNPAWLLGGFVGVDIFLVVSGFLITSILINKKLSPTYSPWRVLNYFYTSRIKRIVPAYYAMIISVALVAAVLYPLTDLSSLKGSLIHATIFNANNFFAGFGDYFAPSNHEQPLLHTWSLAVELQFYLLAPFLILFISKRYLFWLLLTLTITLTMLAEYRMHQLEIVQETYYSLYARLPEFFIGALVAIYLSNKHPLRSSYVQILGFLLLIFAINLQPMLGLFPGISALLPAVGAALLLSVKPDNITLITRLLSNRFLVWIGTLSYSIYLWHWPVLAFLRYYTDTEVLDWQHSLVFIALTIALSIASFYFIEEPLRKNTKPKLRWAVYIGIVMMLGVVGLTLKKVNNHFSNLPIEYTRYAAPNSICHGQIIGDCLKGDLTSDKEVLVLGDSHAAMLNHFFDYLGKELGFKARIITASSCVTIPDFDYRRIVEGSHESCLAQIESANKFIKNADVIFLAAFWSSHLRSTDFVNALLSFLKNTESKQVYLLAQEPLLEKNPLRVIRFSSEEKRQKMSTNQIYEKANIQLDKLASEQENTIFLNFQKTGFFDTAPFYQGTLLYFDKHHLNEVGSVLYAKSIKEFLEDELSSK